MPWRWWALKVLSRCTVATKGGVGTLYTHTWWWNPATVAEVLWRPEGQQRLVRVPPQAREAVMGAATVAQAMASLRRS